MILWTIESNSFSYYYLIFAISYRYLFFDLFGTPTLTSSCTCSWGGGRGNNNTNWLINNNVKNNLIIDNNYNLQKYPLPLPKIVIVTSNEFFLIEGRGHFKCSKVASSVEMWVSGHYPMRLYYKQMKSPRSLVPTTQETHIRASKLFGCGMDFIHLLLIQYQSPSPLFNSRGHHQPPNYPWRPY